MRLAAPEIVEICAGSFTRTFRSFRIKCGTCPNIDDIAKEIALSYLTVHIKIIKKSKLSHGETLYSPNEFRCFKSPSKGFDIEYPNRPSEFSQSYLSQGHHIRIKNLAVVVEHIKVHQL